MGMSDIARELKEDLIHFCARRRTGIILVKLFSGVMVHTEVHKKVSATGSPEEGDDIPFGMCLNLINSLLNKEFFGEVILDVRAGQIAAVDVKRRYRLDSLAKYLRVGGALNGKAAVDY